MKQQFDLLDLLAQFSDLTRNLHEVELSDFDEIRLVHKDLYSNHEYLIRFSLVCIGSKLRGFKVWAVNPFRSVLIALPPSCVTPAQIRTNQKPNLTVLGDINDPGIILHQIHGFVRAIPGQIYDLWPNLNILEIIVSKV